MWQPGKSFQFLGIPPKGELLIKEEGTASGEVMFPISRDPPEGGTSWVVLQEGYRTLFPISRDPPEGGTKAIAWGIIPDWHGDCFQFLGIPPKGERVSCIFSYIFSTHKVSNF